MRKTMAIGMVLLLVLTTFTVFTAAVGAEEYECPVCGNVVLYGQEECDECGEGLEWDDVETTVDIDPYTLNLKSNGRWITCRIYLDVQDNTTLVDIPTVAIVDINGVPVNIPAEWGNCDFDVGGEYGEFDLRCMVKFDRSAVQDACVPGPTTITITGQLTDGTTFEGSDTINVINPP